MTCSLEASRLQPHGKPLRCLSWFYGLRTTAECCTSIWKSQATRVREATEERQGDAYAALADMASHNWINMQRRCGDRIFIHRKQPFPPYCKQLIMWWLQTVFVKAAFRGRRCRLCEVYMPPLGSLNAADGRTPMVYKFAICGLRLPFGSLGLANYDRSARHQHLSTPSAKLEESRWLSPRLTIGLSREQCIEFYL